MTFSTSLDDCTSDFAWRFRAMAEEWADGVPPLGTVRWFLRITRTLSTLEEQAALFAQGRRSLAEVNAMRKAAGLWAISPDENRKTVTDCDGVRIRSRHQGILVDGRLRSEAADVVPAIDPDGPGPLKVRVEWKDRGLFLPLVSLCRNHGLRSGGTFKKQDWPHVEAL